MRVSAGGLSLGVAQQRPHDGQAFARGHQQAGEGMADIVDPDALDARTAAYGGPEGADRRHVAVGPIAGENPSGGRCGASAGVCLLLSPLGQDSYGDRKSVV